MEIKGKKNDLESRPLAQPTDKHKVGVALGHERSQLPQVGPRGEDQVHISLGRMIQEAFDPAKFTEDRKQRVNEIRELWKAGKYWRSSSEIAAALDQEVSLEILTDRARRPLEPPTAKESKGEE